jgi:transportin-3
MTSSTEVTPENFVRAVQMLYHDQDATRKKIASEWLLNVQSSLYAWSLADQLIRMNQNSEVTCLSAQILRHKIQHNFDELPVEHCKALCDSLLDHLSRAELTRNTTVRIQLAVATADLALQYVGWEKPVEDVVEKLKTSSEHMLTLLEFLTALPEEVNTSTIRIGENRRRYCREKYSNCGKQIHEILIFLLQVNPSQQELLFIGILKCFASWISIQAFDEQLLLSSPLLTSILDILKSIHCSNELHKSACDCLCNILELCEEYQKYWSIAVYLKQQITEHLCQPYFQAVKDENLDKAQNYTRIYTNLIESILDCLIDGRQSDLSDLSCLYLLLYPSEHTDYEIVQSTFYTWYRLSELIQTNHDAMIDKIKPYMDKLIDILCVQCKLDPDHLGIPPETDEKSSKNHGSSNSDLGEFRYRVECLIKDTVYITGALNCFQRMFEKLQSSSSLSWEESEAPLYIMSCVASYLPIDEDKIVPNVIQAIISTPTQSGLIHTALKYTGVRLIAQLDEWIAKNNEQILKSIIQYLLSLLVDKELRYISADALLIICQKCRKQLINDLEQIIQATLWLDQIEAGSEAAQCLLKASSKLISRLSSNDDIHRYLNLLFDQQIRSLTEFDYETT